MAEEKKDKTGLYTAIIAGIVALSTGVMTNYDKITGSGTVGTTETKKEVVADTISFGYKLDKIIKDCPNDFSNLTGNKQGVDEDSKIYYSKLYFQEGMSSIYVTDGESPYFDISIYIGSDKTEAQNKKLDIVKKVSEFFKTEPEIKEEKQEDGGLVNSIVFDKGNIQAIIQDHAKTDNSNEIDLIISKK
ncbi:hypothetical protein [Flavobacterium sp.]|uniref:hypothetical protein n=1 Tax=Flavobacterium sp. TaxID=239 RepID=UPI00374DD21B